MREKEEKLTWGQWHELAAAPGKLEVSSVLGLSTVHQKDVYLPAPTFCEEAAHGGVDPSPSVSWAASYLSPTLAPPHPPAQRVGEPEPGRSVWNGVYIADSRRTGGMWRGALRR